MAARNRTGKKPADRGPLLAFTIRQFCEAHGISERQYFILKKLGEGPDEMKVGQRRVVISIEASARWRVKREEAPIKAA